jgi:hypothetical protein
MTGIAPNVVSKNALTNLQELAVTKLDCHNPTLRPTNINSGITNSGSLGFYFAPSASVNNYDATAPTIGVWVANDTPVGSIASSKLDRSPPCLCPAGKAQIPTLQGGVGLLLF